MDWDFIGNEWAVNMLRKQVELGTTRHAYILSGPQGIGKRTLAIKFIQALNCNQSGAHGNPCLECRSCRQVEAMQFADLFIVRLLDENSEIKIEQIKQAQRFLSLTPYESTSKTAIFLDFQLANLSAQNAMLKTLEESPGNSRLIITTDSTDLLLPTIVSRCEVINLRPVPAMELSFALMSQLKIESQLTELLGHISGGRYGYARHLAEDSDLLDQRDTWLDEWNEILGMSLRHRFKFIESKLSRRAELKKQREMLQKMINCWTLFARDVLLTSSGTSGEPINIDRKDQILSISKNSDPEKMAGIIHNLEKASERIDTNCNIRLVMETLMLEVGSRGSVNLTHPQRGR
jgi:DNA polymerase-3 subunit delta'